MHRRTPFVGHAHNGFGVKRTAPGQLGLFDTDSEQTARIRGAFDWPPQQRFPINLFERSVQDTLLADVASTRDFLVITGFSSLEYLISRIGGEVLHQRETPPRIRLLFGHEPDRGARRQDRARFEEARKAAENFWRMGDDFTDRLLELLESLLRVVSFEEAVARASAELLEGE